MSEIRVEIKGYLRDRDVREREMLEKERCSRKRDARERGMFEIKGYLR